MGHVDGRALVGATETLHVAWKRARVAVTHVFEGGFGSALAPVAGSAMAAGVALVAGSAWGDGAPQFTMHALPGVSAAINDSNDVTLVRAASGGRQVGGVYDLDFGTFRPLTSAMVEVTLTDISDSGWVAGTVRPTGGARSVVAWNPQGRRATLRGASAGVITGPFVNEAGRVVWGDTSGFSWTPGSRSVTSASLTGVARTMRQITDDNVVLGMSGSRGVLVPANGPLVTVPTDDAATWSEVIEANDEGQMLVSAASSGGLRQLVWDQGTGGFTWLCDPVNGRVMSMSRALNDHGDVVGAGIVPGMMIPDSMLWTGGTGYSFRELLGGAYPAGWSGFLMPVDINNNGVILGVGTYNGATTWFVMKPVGAWGGGT